jgi:hypothetical protein
MLAPAIIGKLGIKRSLVFSATMMSMFAFGLVVIGWRTTLSSEKITEYRAVEMGHGLKSVGSFFYAEGTCRIILVIANICTGIGQGILWVA